MAIPQLGGSLDFSPLRANADLYSGIGQNPATAATQLGGLYKGGYLGALNLNEQNYSNILGGFGDLAQSQDQTQQGIIGGFGDLNNRVQGRLGSMDTGLANYQNSLAGLLGTASPTGHVGGNRDDSAGWAGPPANSYAGLQRDVQAKLEGSNQSNINDINNRYNVEQGQLMQNAISNGLGGSTVAMGLQAGVDTRRAQETTRSQNMFAQSQAGAMQNIGLSGLGAQQQGMNTILGQQNLIGQTRAGYENNIGLAGLNYQGQASQNNTNLGLRQLDFQNSVNVPYPDGNQFNALAQQYGYAAQQQQDRDIANKQFQAIQQQGNRQAPQLGGGTTLGSGTPLPGPQGNYGGQGNFAGFGGSMYAPDGTYLQAQRPSTMQYGVGGTLGAGASLGGLGAASAGGFGNAGGVGAASAGAIGAGVGSYLNGLGQDYNLANEDLPYGGTTPPVGQYLPGTLNRAMPQPLGTVPYQQGGASQADLGAAYNYALDQQDFGMSQELYSLLGGE